MKQKDIYDDFKFKKKTFSLYVLCKVELLSMQTSASNYEKKTIPCM